ncbi:class I SAM-dependent methyltransferase [Nocardia sp. NPDC046763]|uniref:class I SAM-dependent methyltransferase n=1 Tax=Nocardia sp. NPDC046763 TaxID=3155256 RepID=UPI0033E4CB0F
MTTPSLASEYTSLDPLQVRIDTHRRFSEITDDVNQVVAEALRLGGGEYLVDIGCGTGEFLAHLMHHGHQGPLAGIDTSPAAVAAAAQVPGVDGFRGAAEDLPLADSVCDVLTARHMLYHLTDPMRALREFRRVTKPGGTVCVVVNHPRTCQRTHDLVAGIAEQYELTAPAGMINEDVNSDTVPDMMTEVFGNAAVHRMDNALIFPTPEPAIRFAESLFSFCGIASDHPQYTRIRADVEAKLGGWFHDNPGQTWRDPKGYTVTTAIRPAPSETLP